MWRQWLPLAIATLALSACNPYYRFKGDASAGAVDPVNFLTAYLGTGGDANTPGEAKLIPVVATATDGTSVGYFSFPYTQVNDDGTADLSLSTAGKITAPIAYDFDEDGTTHCKVADGYVYDQQRDQVRYDEQGNIFVGLPDNPGYTPAVADVVVHSNGLPCQAVKSDDRLVKRKDVTFALPLTPAMNPSVPGAHPTGTPASPPVFFARPIIDPTIDVKFADGSTDPETGLGPQKWGWYGRYLLAWLDGGTIPTLSTTVKDQDMQPQVVVEADTQAIYYPISHPGKDGSGNAAIVPGALGDGYDLITAAAGQPGFSPICQAISFIPKDPMAPETKIADIDTTTMVNTGTTIWCIQAPNQVAQ